MPRSPAFPGPKTSDPAPTPTPLRIFHRPEDLLFFEAKRPEPSAFPLRTNANFGSPPGSPSRSIVRDFPGPKHPQRLGPTASTRDPRRESATPPSGPLRRRRPARRSKRHVLGFAARTTLQEPSTTPLDFAETIRPCF